MTTAQKKGMQYAALIVGAAMTVAFSAGLARRELDQKEDRATHAADLREMQSAIREERNLRELQQIRDSATMSVVLDRLNDIACLQNPNRGYCR
jgi:hypothetical protein